MATIKNKIRRLNCARQNIHDVPAWQTPAIVPSSAHLDRRFFDCGYPGKECPLEVAFDCLLLPVDPGFLKPCIVPLRRGGLRNEAGEPEAHRQIRGRYRARRVC